MKFLLDQGLPHTAASFMAAAGHDAVHTGDIGMARASDMDIIIKARNESRVVAALDGDFHAILAHTKAVSPSVIRVRIENLKGRQMADILIAVAAKWEDQLAAGCVVTVTPGRMRLRMLPLASPR